MINLLLAIRINAINDGQSTMQYLWVRCPAIREKVFERPVRRDRQHEAVNPVEREKVLQTHINVHIVWRDVLRHLGQQRNDNDKRYDGSSPVDAVAIPAGSVRIVTLY